MDQKGYVILVSIVAIVAITILVRQTTTENQNNEDLTGQAIKTTLKKINIADLLTTPPKTTNPNIALLMRQPPPMEEIFSTTQSELSKNKFREIRK